MSEGRGDRVVTARGRAEARRQAPGLPLWAVNGVIHQSGRYCPRREPDVARHHPGHFNATVAATWAATDLPGVTVGAARPVCGRERHAGGDAGRVSCVRHIGCPGPVPDRHYEPIVDSCLEVGEITWAPGPAEPIRRIPVGFDPVGS